MATWPWIALYAVCALAYVPICAKLTYDPRSRGIIDGDKTATVFVAILSCYAWPLFATGYGIYLLSKFVSSVLWEQD